MPKKRALPFRKFFVRGKKRALFCRCGPASTGYTRLFTYNRVKWEKQKEAVPWNEKSGY